MAEAANDLVSPNRAQQALSRLNQLHKQLDTGKTGEDAESTQKHCPVVVGAAILDIQVSIHYVVLDRVLCSTS